MHASSMLVGAASSKAKENFTWNSSIDLTALKGRRATLALLPSFYEVCRPGRPALGKWECQGTTLTTPSGEQGIFLEFFNNPDYVGPPVHTQVVGSGRLVWYGEMPPSVDPDNFSVRATTKLVPAQSGDGRFILQAGGVSVLGGLRYSPMSVSSRPSLRPFRPFLAFLESLET